MEYVNFRKLLINRCQLEFEKNLAETTLRNVKLKDIDQCKYAKTKNELQLLLEEDVRRALIRFVGTIRFIGELFKQQMLTVKIMIRCINILLENNHEGNLEALCTLLTIIGKELEVGKKQNLQQFFNIIEDIVEKKPTNVSSRVRFMLQDVITLRKSNWLPPPQDLRSKTLEQVLKEANMDQLNIQEIATSHNDERDRRRRNQTDDSWSMATSSRNRAPYQFEFAKLSNVKPPAPEEMTLGSKQMFGTWGRSSIIKPHQHHASVTNTTNMFVAVDIPKKLTAEQFKLRTQNAVDELVNDCCSLAECEAEIRASVEPSRLHKFVEYAYMNNLDSSPSVRRKVGELVAHLVRCGLVSVKVYRRAVAKVLSQADGLVIDIPKIWEYLAELLAPLVVKESAVTLGQLLATCASELRIEGHAHKVLAQLLMRLVAYIGPGLVAERWRKSGARLTDFVAADELESYVKEHNLGFLYSSVIWDRVHAKLLQFFRANTPFDTVTGWISANVGERVSDKPFIRTLVSAIAENAVVMSNKTLKLQPGVLRKHYSLLQRYVDKESLQLQCCFALQAVVHKWQHPPDLLLAIFVCVWEDGVLSHDSLLAWCNSDDPAEQEGKGIALKSVQSLFTALREVDDESGSSISEDA